MMKVLSLCTSRSLLLSTLSNMWANADKVLPNKDMRVIVYATSIHTKDRSVEVADFQYSDGEFYIGGRSARVSHWMPLPPPP